MYYKVVVNENGIFKSTNTAFMESQYNIQYPINEWVYPPIKGSGLFIVKGLSNAVCFRNYVETVRTCCTKIFECQVRNPRQWRYLTSVIQFEKLWQDVASLRKGKLSMSNLRSKGWMKQGEDYCYIANAVKLVKEVS